MDQPVSDNIRHVTTSLVGLFRAPIDFFLGKDAAIKRYFPDPFPHWQRSDRHFNLINPEARKVIRFDANRFVMKAEGHPSLRAFGELLRPTEDLLELFGVSEVFGTVYTDMRALSKSGIDVARREFAERFLSDTSRNVLPYDELTDYAVVVERQWHGGKGFKKAERESAPVRIVEVVQVGPVTYEEIAKRKWVEFREDAEHELYRRSHAAPTNCMLVQMRFEMHRANEPIDLKWLWEFYDWARGRAQETWEKTTKEVV